MGLYNIKQKEILNQVSGWMNLDEPIISAQFHIMNHISELLNFTFIFHRILTMINRLCEAQTLKPFMLRWKISTHHNLHDMNFMIIYNPPEFKYSDKWLNYSCHTVSFFYLILQFNLFEFHFNEHKLLLLWVPLMFRQI